MNTTMDFGGDGQTLDDIIRQNRQEMMRRSTTHNAQYQTSNSSDHLRRLSMLEFGTGSNEFDDFQFDPSPSLPSNNGTPRLHSNAQKQHDPRKIRSREDLALDTSNVQMSSAYNSAISYSPAMIASAPLDMDSPYLQHGIDMGLGMGYNNASGEMTPVNMQNSARSPLFQQSPMQHSFHTSFAEDFAQMNDDTQMMDDQDLSTKMPQMTMVDNDVKHAAQAAASGKGQDLQAERDRNMASAAVIPPTAAVIPSESREMLDPKEKHEILETPARSKMNNVYSSTGFDMLGVLMRVATRPKPQISIGPVDLSCAFVVCDITKHDSPIVYCSDVFERMTGYTRWEILGRNCRFLQAPDGKVQAGVKRKYVDDNSVLQLKNKVNKREEIQLSLINYRKGGQPFMNLLTMIPITWDSDEFKYYVGFQVDLVEQPNSVAGKNPGMQFVRCFGSMLNIYRRLICHKLPTSSTSTICDAGSRPKRSTGGHGWPDNRAR